MTTCDVSEQRRHGKEKSSLHTPVNFNEHSTDSKAYDRLTRLLLGGHIKVSLAHRPIMSKLISVPKEV